MKREPTYVGIDVAKDRVAIAVRPTGQSWSASYEEEEVEKLVARLQENPRPRSALAELGTLGCGATPVPSGLPFSGRVL